MDIGIWKVRSHRRWRAIIGRGYSRKGDIVWTRDNWEDNRGGVVSGTKYGRLKI